MESRQPPKRMKKRRDLNKLLISTGRGLHVSKKRAIVADISSSEDLESASSSR